VARDLEPMQLGTQRGLSTVRYLIDTAASRFTVKAFATGLLSAFGHSPTIAVRDYEGEVHFVPGSYDKAFVRVLVKMSGLEVLDEMKRDDRQQLEENMYGNVLESARYPSAVYESQQIDVLKVNEDVVSASVVGDLLFHGVSRSQRIEARVLDMRTMLRVSGEFTLSQSDYAIKPFSFAGVLRLKDELKFSFEVVARRED
jgi:polyisoprenoid-binding protein YceI